MFSKGELIIAAVILIAAMTSFSTNVNAHCDTLDGPVVSSARKALDSGNVNYVLIWVQSKDEKEIRNAFQKTLSVRKSGGDARDLADNYFFETLVRVHRAGEGAPYTGLKATSEELGPAIPASDKAIATGNLEPVNKMIVSLVTEGLKGSFQKVKQSKKFDVNDVRAGREYVENYVRFIQYVERLYEDSKTSADGHFPEKHAEPHVEHHD